MAKTVNIKSDLSFKERLSALKNLPELFKLVWKSRPGKTTLNFALRIVRSAMPVTLLYVGKLIIDQAMQLNRHGGSQHELWKLVLIKN
jgi:ATP-binding cassette subfamily B protein